MLWQKKIDINISKVGETIIFHINIYIFIIIYYFLLLFIIRMTKKNYITK